VTAGLIATPATALLGACRNASLAAAAGLMTKLLDVAAVSPLPGRLDRWAFQAAIGVAFVRQMERRPIQTAKERGSGAPLGLVVRRLERRAFQAGAQGVAGDSR